MKEEQNEIEKQFTKDTSVNSTDNVKKNQESIDVQNTLKDVAKENNSLKKSPFFINNEFSIEKKRKVLGLKMDRKKLKLNSNKKIKKSKKSSQNLFALSFFKNCNENSNLIDNSYTNTNTNTNTIKNDNNEYDIDKSSQNNELKYIKQENIMTSSESSQKSIENYCVENGKEGLDSSSENIKLKEQNKNLIPNDTYESQKCPICNLCLDFYTITEREKHVNLCIDSSIRKENKRNLVIKKEDNKIFSFYKNIKNNDNVEKPKEEESNYNNFGITNNIQNEFVTNTLNDIDSMDISNLPSDENQFKCKICDKENSFSNKYDLYVQLFPHKLATVLNNKNIYFDLK